MCYNKNMKVSGVYQILNRVNDKCYIGSAVNLRQRRNGHWNTLKQGIHYNRYLQNAWNKYGKESFSFKIIEYVADPKRLVKREQYYLDALNSEYNLSPTAGSSLGVIHTPETRKKVSKVTKGRIPWNGAKFIPHLRTEWTIWRLMGGNGKPKLTESQVKEIHSLLKDKTLREIGSMFGVSRQTIWLIKEERMWKHIKKKDN